MLFLPQNLDVTVALYNQVRETILDVEYPLIETQLVEIDQQLERAISQLNWTSSGTYCIWVTTATQLYCVCVQCVCIHGYMYNNCVCIAGAWEYIEVTRDMVCDLERRVRLAKGNVETIVTIMGGWCQAPLYRRREDKKEQQSLLNIEVVREGV